MVFDPSITTFMRDLLPWAGAFFSLVTEMGGEIFLVSVLLIAFWSYRKREAIVLTLIIIVSVLTNYWLKYVIGNPRPPASYWYGDLDATNYSTPSDHAQNAGAMYSWLGAKVKTWWMILVSIILMFLIGISRVYLGVHFLGDILLGWSIGITIGLVAFYYESQISLFASRLRTEYWYLLLFIIGIILLVIGSILPYPPGDNFGALGGLTIGAAVAFPLENRYVKFDLEVGMPRLIARVVIGLVLVIGMMLGLHEVLPTAEIWLRTLRYFLVAFVGIFLWPMIFKRAGL
ncbi:MAG: phosphatase PAP2 family protein [Candidatus Thorarchaeota archaeon]